MGVLAIPFPEIDPVALRLGPLSVKWYGLAYMAGPAARLALRQVFAAARPAVAGRQAAVCSGQGRRSPALHDDRRAGRRAPRQRALLRAGLLPAKPARDPGRVEGGHGFPRRAHRLHHRYRALRAAQPRRTPGARSTCARQPRRSACSSGGSPISSMPSCGAGRATCPGHSCSPAQGPCRGMRASSTRQPWRGSSCSPYCGGSHSARLALHKPGVVAGTFLVGYGVARSFCELFREPDFNVGPLSAGVLYSLPMVVAGIWMIRTALRRTAASAHVQPSG